VSTSEPSRRELAELYRCHHAYVRRCLRRGGLSSDALDDAVHDVFAVLVRRLADYRPEHSMRQWLAGISRNVASAHRRRSRRTVLDHGSRAVDPGAFELHVDLHRSLAALAECERAAVLLADGDGLTAHEIAAMQGVPLTTAQWRIRSGRARLRALMGRLQTMLAGALAFDRRTWSIPTAGTTTALGAAALTVVLAVPVAGSQHVAPTDLAASSPVHEPIVATEASAVASALPPITTPRARVAPEGHVRPGDPTIIPPPASLAEPEPPPKRPRRRPTKRLSPTPTPTPIADFTMDDHRVPSTRPPSPPR